MYHLLIERVSTVMIEFLQYRARVQIGLNRAGIERAVERTGLFTSLQPYIILMQTKSLFFNQPISYSLHFSKNSHVIVVNITISCCGRVSQ
jgi:hypothetical protein